MSGWIVQCTRPDPDTGEPTTYSLMACAPNGMGKVDPRVTGHRPVLIALTEHGAKEVANALNIDEDGWVAKEASP